MIPTSLEIGKTPSGKFKLYIMGQHDEHMMDWYGCNFRTFAVEGQPLRGYETPREVLEFARKTFKSDKAFRQYAAACGNGTHLNDERYKRMETRSVFWRKGEKECICLNLEE